MNVLQIPVLVLNANFEPINVCNIRRAMGLILTGKADLVQNGRGEIRTVKRAYPIPSVIRLERKVRRPRPQVKLTKKEIFRRDNHTCQYCGQRVSNPTIDHVIPRHLGGEYSWENLVTACSNCNRQKGGRTVEQARMRLLRKPTAPPASAVYIFERYLQYNQDWVPFIEGW